MSDKFRIQFDEDATEAIDRLRRMTRRESREEVVRDAMAVYELLVRRAGEGGRLFVGLTRSQVTEFPLPMLDEVRRRASADRESQAWPSVE